MKNIKKIVSAAVICAFTLSFTGCNLVSKTPEAIAKSPVAKVGGEYITRSQLDSNSTYIQQLNQLKAQDPNVEKTDAGKEQIKQLKQKVLEQVMIPEKVIMQQSKKMNIKPDDTKIAEEVQKQFDSIKKNYSDDQKFKDAMKQANYTEQSLKDEIRTQVIEQKVVDEATKDITIDDAKAKQYYDANQTSYTEKPDMIKLAHILVKTEDEAKKVEERLKNGEDFGKLAKELSTDTGSKDKGGEYEVPYVGSGFDDTFMKAALALKEGQISQPIQTQFGYHVIKTIKKTEYPAKPFDKVKDEIKKTLLDKEKQEAFQKKLDQWKKDANIDTKKYEKNLI